MANHPLLTDKSIALSTTLAATIGLEQALLLTVLNDAACTQQGAITHIATETLRQQLPFWDDTTIRRILNHLVSQGLIQVQGAQYPDHDVFSFCFERQSTQASAMTNPPATQLAQPATSSPQPPVRAPEHSTTARQPPLHSRWQPEETTLQRLAQRGIPASFCWTQLDAFIIKGQEQGANQNDWNTRFFKYAIQQWTYAQNDARRDQQRQERSAFNVIPDEAKPMESHWQPSADALQILHNASIDPQFISDAIPEFVLYWQERGDAFKTWNSKFIQHVRQQWARFSASAEHSSLPTPMTEQWQPSADCYDILALAHIDAEFAQRLVPEFVLYWRDAKQVHNSWNSRFLQHVKQQWGKRLAQRNAGESHVAAGASQSATQPGYATAEASIQRLKDTSW